MKGEDLKSSTGTSKNSATRHIFVLQLKRVRNKKPVVDELDWNVRVVGSEGGEKCAERTID